MPDPFSPSAEFYEKAYSTFIHARWKGSPIKLEPLDYDLFRSQQKQPFRGLKHHHFRQNVDDLARELVNEINKLWRTLLDLGVWSDVISNYASEERFHLHHEFLDEKCESALIKPYTIKNRFIHSASTIAFLVDGVFRQRAFPEEHKVNFKDMEKWVGTWPGFAEFSNSLANLNDKTFVKKTADFRHRSQHRIPPMIGEGLVPGLRVQQTGSKFSFSLATLSPLALEDVLILGTQQYQRATETMRTFWNMMQQADGRWKVTLNLPAKKL